MLMLMMCGDVHQPCQLQPFRWHAKIRNLRAQPFPGTTDLINNNAARYCSNYLSTLLHILPFASSSPLPLLPSSSSPSLSSLRNPRGDPIHSPPAQPGQPTRPRITKRPPCFTPNPSPQPKTLKPFHLRLKSKHYTNSLSSIKHPFNN